MYLLGYDIGSSSVKAALVDALTGKCIASDFFRKTEAPIKALRQGWAEQDPDSWWHYLKEATRSILADSKISPWVCLLKSALPLYWRILQYPPNKTTPSPPSAGKESLYLNQ